MDKFKGLKGKIKKTPFLVLAYVLFLLACALSVWFISSNDLTAKDAFVLDVSFEGEYKIADGDWAEIADGEHISATKGDVTLRGRFKLCFPDGEVVTYNPVNTYINLYFNHVSAVIEAGEDKHVFDAEHPEAGDSVCGVIWLSYLFPESEDGYTEIVISNPHSYGNESAIDDFLSNMRLEEPALFQNTIAKENDPVRYLGFSFMAMSLILLGIATVSSVLRIKGAMGLWVIGGWMFFTGGYYVMDVMDVFLWYANVSFNTASLCLCRMLSTLFLGLFVTGCTSGTNRKITTVAHLVMALLICAFAVLSAFGVIHIFDTLMYWQIAQTAIIILTFACCIREMAGLKNSMRLVLGCCLISFALLLVDFLRQSFTWWYSFDISKICFALLFIVVICFGVYTIISNYKMSLRTKEMEAELKDKSIAVMISQIQPHFLYNSLNSIAELCVVDPKRAEKATIDFSRYLRGNMGALNEKKTIEFDDELNHLNHYIELEKLRYGDDLQFEFDIKARAFTLPALTVQPLVENAVNHGIRYYKTKGRVKISSYEDEKNNYVCIEDDGVGFDVDSLSQDGKKHVGIANVKYRLKVMCEGSVEINSQKGSGTIVKIVIPKGKMK